jgi:hypothetical protein
MNEKHLSSQFDGEPNGGAGYRLTAPPREDN